MAFPAIHTVATPIASPGAMRRVVPSKQLWTVRGQVEPALQHLLQGRGLQRDQVTFLFCHPHPVDTTFYAVQAGCDATAPFTDGQKALRPEVSGEDQISKGPDHLVTALAGYLFPLLIVVGQVDQAIRCASV